MRRLRHAFAHPARLGFNRFNLTFTDIANFEGRP
jgi:hypothetical protein